MPSAQTYRDLLKSGWTMNQIADKFEIAPDSVRRSLSRLTQLPSARKTSPRNAVENHDVLDTQSENDGISAKSPAGETFTAIDIPDSRPTFDESPFVVNSKNALVIGDLHIPYHNRLMLKRAIYITRTYYPHVTDVIIGGDLYDFASLSHYSHNQKDATANDTVLLAGDVLRALLRYFKRCFICNGNHDERFAKKLDSQWDLELLINASMGRDWPDCDIQVTNLDYLYLGDNWIIGHPSNYSGQGGKTPSDYADLYQKNVATLHNHVIGMSQSKSGKYIGVDVGHMTQAGMHYYQKRRMTKFTRWNSGFLIVSDDFPYQYTEHWTDWDKFHC